VISCLNYDLFIAKIIFALLIYVYRECGMLSFMILFWDMAGEPKGSEVGKLIQITVNRK
jgi:hypothetical protein